MDSQQGVVLQLGVGCGADVSSSEIDQNVTQGLELGHVLLNDLSEGKWT
jgi:hypothetical protein